MIDFTDDELYVVACGIDYYTDVLKAVLNDPTSEIDKKVSAAKELKLALSSLQKVCKLSEDRGRSLLDADVSLEDLGIFSNVD